MTKDDICKWMHMAWDFTSEDNLKRKFEYQEAHYIPYEKFARLVAEHEREACERLCLQGTGLPVQTDALRIITAERERIAEAIRARGEK